MKFDPKYLISKETARNLMRVEAVCQVFSHLPLTVAMQSRLRETARMVSPHYSTENEGNRLTLKQAQEVVEQNAHFSGRERDEEEVLGYYLALDEVEAVVKRRDPVSEKLIKYHHDEALDDLFGREFSVEIRLERWVEL